jgi:SAM-dependent methyltransferase
MLHIAPEVCFHDQFTHIKGLYYVSGDVEHREGIAVQMDITALPCPSKFFDAIYCSHVLEHVPDDRRALREFRRVLKPGGWALLHIPVLIDGPTFENPGVTGLEERERLFGQFDHVRRYGVDFSDRLIEAGLKARFVTAKQIASEKERKRMGIPEWEGFWFSVVPNEGLRS